MALRTLNRFVSRQTTGYELLYWRVESQRKTACRGRRPQGRQVARSGAELDVGPVLSFSAG
jgi:hypothetical protein